MKPLPFVLLVNLLFVLFRILYIQIYPTDLSPEEAQYWDWSRHPDLSYYSKPPMVAYLILLARNLLGDTEIAVRITPLILSAVLSVATFLFLKRHADTKTAVVASTVPHLLVGTSINSVLMTTDAPFVFFWGLTLFAIYEAVNRRSLHLWLVVGVLGGLSFLSKYTAVFLLPLSLIYLFLLNRRDLLSWRPYVSLLPAFLLSLPVLVWNYRNDWVSLKHVLSLGVSGSPSPNLSTFLEFLGGQLVLMSLVPFFLMIIGWLRPRSKVEVFLTVFSFPIIAVFGLLSLQKEVYANWTAPALFGGTLLASFQMARRSTALVLSLVLAAPLFLILHFTPLLDLIGLRSLLPPNRDPVKVMVGWRDLGREVGSVYSKGDLIISDRYQIAAELAFYVPGNPRTFVFHRGRRTQYYLWRYMLKHYTGKDGLFVTEGDLPEGLKKSFSSIEFLKSMDVYWRGERIKTFYIYRLKGFRGVLHENPKGY